MGQITREYRRLTFTIPSGATGSTPSQPVLGYVTASLAVPVGTKGNLFYRAKHAKTATEGRVHYEQAPTQTGAITQVIAGYTKPLVLPVRDEVLKGGMLRIIATSTQTAEKKISMLLKG